MFSSPISVTTRLKSRDLDQNDCSLSFSNLVSPTSASPGLRCQLFSPQQNDKKRKLKMLSFVTPSPSISRHENKVNKNDVKAVSTTLDMSEDVATVNSDRKDKAENPFIPSGLTVEVINLDHSRRGYPVGKGLTIGDFISLLLHNPQEDITNLSISSDDDVSFEHCLVASETLNNGTTYYLRKFHVVE